MTIGKNLIIILTLFLITNISYAVETKEEFATEKPSIKLHKKSGQSKSMAEDFVRKNKNGNRFKPSCRREGGDFFVSVGTSGIALDNSFANFGDARQDAFDIAFYSQKQFINKGQRISTNIVNERKQGSYARTACTRNF